MEKNRFSISKTAKKDVHRLFDKLFDYCNIDKLSGCFHCKKCNSVVQVDLSKKLAFCPIHGILI